MSRSKFEFVSTHGILGQIPLDSRRKSNQNAKTQYLLYGEHTSCARSMVFMLWNALKSCAFCYAQNPWIAFPSGQPPI